MHLPVIAATRGIHNTITILFAHATMSAHHHIPAVLACYFARLLLRGANPSLVTPPLLFVFNYIFAFLAAPPLCCTLHDACVVYHSRFGRTHSGFFYLVPFLNLPHCCICCCCRYERVAVGVPTAHGQRQREYRVRPRRNSSAAGTRCVSERVAVRASECVCVCPQ